MRSTRRRRRVAAARAGAAPPWTGPRIAAGPAAARTSSRGGAGRAARRPRCEDARAAVPADSSRSAGHQCGCLALLGVYVGGGESHAADAPVAAFHLVDDDPGHLAQVLTFDAHHGLGDAV